MSIRVDICQGVRTRRATRTRSVLGRQRVRDEHQDDEEPRFDWRHGEECLVLRLPGRFRPISTGFSDRD